MTRSPFIRWPLVWPCALVLASALAAAAEDWPEWRGKGRLGEWNETGIVEAFPEDGLDFTWRVPINPGYTGPAVAEGRVFVTDFIREQGTRGVERALCLDEKTGKTLWTETWPADYHGLNRGIGPRATPTVDGDRVYFLGAVGMLQCREAETGKLFWKVDYLEDFDADLQIWGMCSAPVVVGKNVIALVGGAGDAKVVAFDRETGKETWRALSSDSAAGYTQPAVFEIAGRAQAIIWHPKAVASLDPATGALLWEIPFRVSMAMTVATPVLADSRLLVSSFYNGSLMIDVSEEKAVAKELWRGKSKSEIRTDGLHSLNSTPVMEAGFVYGVGSYGQLRCLNAKTGERLWHTFAATEHARWATAFIVKAGDRYFINNDRGELIIAQLSPQGYREISRTTLIEPTTREEGRREMNGRVNWSHPAYANRHVIARNDKEIVRASLAK